MGILTNQSLSLDWSVRAGTPLFIVWITRQAGTTVRWLATLQGSPLRLTFVCLILHSALVNDTACRTNHDEGEENTEAAVVFLSSSTGPRASRWWDTGLIERSSWWCSGVKESALCCHCVVLWDYDVVAHHGEQEQADRVGWESSCGAIIFCVQLVAGLLAVSWSWSIVLGCVGCFVSCFTYILVSDHRNFRK